MAKVKQETVKTNTDKIKDAIEALKIQANEYQTMAVKAQGALEVLRQLDAKENDNEEGKKE